MNAKEFVRKETDSQIQRIGGLLSRVTKNEIVTLAKDMSRDPHYTMTEMLDTDEETLFLRDLALCTLLAHLSIRDD